jgi:hypothetical protein
MIEFEYLQKFSIDTSSNKKWRCQIRMLKDARDFEVGEARYKNRIKWLSITVEKSVCHHGIFRIAKENKWEITASVYSIIIIRDSEMGTMNFASSMSRSSQFQTLHCGRR